MVCGVWCVVELDVDEKLRLECDRWMDRDR